PLPTSTLFPYTTLFRSLLVDRKVLLEPALMQLRFSEEVLRPRFDLEMVGADTIVARATFVRPGDTRYFPLTQGGWFEGWPSSRRSEEHTSELQSRENLV